MSDLRTAALHALDALWYYHATELGKDTPAGEAITMLQNALAQPIWVCPEAPQTHRYTRPGHCKNCGKELMFLDPVTPSCQDQTP